LQWTLVNALTTWLYVTLQIRFVTVAHEAWIWTNPTSGRPVDFRIAEMLLGLQRDSRYEILLKALTGSLYFLNSSSYLGHDPCTGGFAGLLRAESGVAVRPIEMDMDRKIVVVIRFITPPFI
jgi:hypothetical protein